MRGRPPERIVNRLLCGKSAAIGSHQYVDRETGAVRTEKLIGDAAVNFIYSTVRENASHLFDCLVSARVSSCLAHLHFDLPVMRRNAGSYALLRNLGVNPAECLAGAGQLNTPRRIFERQIRYWQCRPMPDAPQIVVSPADSRVLVGSFERDSQIFLKEKFFDYAELLGPDKSAWLDTFRHGDFAVFRLTPDKYHYNHVPVTGRVADTYAIDGAYHSCNPGAVATAVTPFSKNKRVVTILDTDIEGGARIGKVAMIEIVALMIGGIRQCYSARRYDDPQNVVPGMLLEKGQPKSLFRPGSSVDVLVFEKGRIDFWPDIVGNLHRCDAESRFSSRFQQPVVETDVTVRSAVARARNGIQGKTVTFNNRQWSIEKESDPC